MREKLEMAGFYDYVKKEMLYITTHDAVLASLENDPDMMAEVNYTIPACFMAISLVDVMIASPGCLL